MKLNVFIKKNIICKTACSQINFPFFLMFCLGCCLAFPSFFGKFQASVAHERVAYKKACRLKLKRKRK